MDLGGLKKTANSPSLYTATDGSQYPVFDHLLLTTQSQGTAGFNHIQFCDDLAGVHALISWLHIRNDQVSPIKCVSEDKCCSF